MTFTPPNPPFIAARWHGGSQTPKLIVLHSTVGPTRTGSAKSVAEFFARGEHVASAHYVVDEGTKFQCVHDHTVAYHCGFNQDSIGVEMCDFPSQDKRRWDDGAHRHLELRTARLVAKLCLAYNIRPYYVGVLGLKLGVKGVTTHNNMSLAFKKSTHWDPGAWRRKRFMREVRRQIRLIKARQG
jgi:N-acetylmuramoyl-L-alanine amidase CwlA